MRIGEILRKYRLHQEQTLEEMAGEIGVSPATLSRVERGEGMDGETLAKIIVWEVGE